MQNLYQTLYADHYGRYQELFAGRCLLDLGTARPGGWMPDQFRDSVHLKAEYRSELSQRFAVACDHACASDLAAARPPDGALAFDGAAASPVTRR
jgi:hypothetical protein